MIPVKLLVKRIQWTYISRRLLTRYMWNCLTADVKFITTNCCFTDSSSKVDFYQVPGSGFLHCYYRCTMFLFPCSLSWHEIQSANQNEIQK